MSIFLKPPLSSSHSKVFVRGLDLLRQQGCEAVRQFDCSPTSLTGSERPTHSSGSRWTGSRSDLLQMLLPCKLEKIKDTTDTVLCFGHNESLEARQYQY